MISNSRQILKWFQLRPLQSTMRTYKDLVHIPANVYSLYVPYKGLQDMLWRYPTVWGRSLHATHGIGSGHVWWKHFTVSDLQSVLTFPTNFWVVEGVLVASFTSRDGADTEPAAKLVSPFCCLTEYDWHLMSELCGFESQDSGSFLLLPQLHAQLVIKLWKFPWSVNETYFYCHYASAC